jgi:hypothetical protein
MRMKRGDLSLNTIIVAAIVLIVLVVIIIIFSSRLGMFSKGLNDCTNKGGNPTSASSCQDGEAEIFKFKSEGSQTEDMRCCLPIGKDKEPYGYTR